MTRFNAWPIISLFLAGIVISGALFLFALHAGGIDGVGLTTAMAKLRAEAVSGVAFAQESLAMPVDSTLAGAENSKLDRAEKTAELADDLHASAASGSGTAHSALPGETPLEAVTTE